MDFNRGNERQKLRQRKSLGQVFLTCEGPCHQVVQLLRDTGSTQTMEIGPGAGILTRTLLEAGISVVAIEKDRRFYGILQDQKGVWQKKFGGSLELINADILRFDLSAWHSEHPQEQAIVGNIPYNISSPIIKLILGCLDRLKIAVLMVQWEFAERLTATVGTKAYGSLSVYTQLRSKVEVASKIDRSLFKPIPKVDSALITITKNPNILPQSQLKNVETVARMAFNQRRKKLKNSIATLFKDQAHLEGCPIDVSRRADAVDLQEYVALAEYLLE